MAKKPFNNPFEALAGRRDALPGTTPTLRPEDFPSTPPADGPELAVLRLESRGGEEVTVVAELGLPPAELRAWLEALQRGLACHGEEGANGLNDRLVGGHGTLTSLQQVRTIGSFWPYASTVFDYIRRAMPFQAPQSLTNDEVYALTAYLLFKNGIIKEGDVINARTLPRVEMPNRDGFVLAYP